MHNSTEIEEKWLKKMGSRLGKHYKKQVFPHSTTETEAKHYAN